jgi:hypothetical protein
MVIPIIKKSIPPTNKNIPKSRAKIESNIIAQTL